MTIVWSDVAVQAAIISAVGNVLATLIAGFAAALIGKVIDDRVKLKNRLKIAQSDIAFLLKVEQLHGEIHRAEINQSFKQTVRREAIEEGLTWSGLFTPGKVRNEQ